MVKSWTYNGPRHRNIVEWLVLKCLLFLYRQPPIFKPRPKQARRHPHGQALGIHKPRVLLRRYNIAQWLASRYLHFLYRQPPFDKARSIQTRRHKPRVLLPRKRPMLWCRRPQFLKPSGNILQPGILLSRVRIPHETDVNAWKLDHTRNVEHPEFPNNRKRPYTVFVSTHNAKFRKGCMCPWAGTGFTDVLFSNTTKKGLVMCSCPGAEHRQDGATYHGEFEDPRPFLRIDDLSVPGSQSKKKKKKKQATS
jgi:hypothetical protein